MLTPLYAAAAGATAAHPYNLEVNATDVIAKVPMESIRIEAPGPGTNGSMSFVIEDATASVSVAAWDEVIFTEHAATRPVLFGGFVQSARMVAWATTGRTITVECVGYGVLLDKKVVDQTGFESSSAMVAYHLISLVNRHGGRITGLGNFTAPGYIETYVSSVTNTVAHSNLWNWMGVQLSVWPETTVPATLRSVIDQWIEQSGDFDYTNYGFDTWLPATRVYYWVDALARLHAHAETTGNDTVSWDGDCPVAISETTGTGLVRASALEYETENTGRLDRVFVAGATVTDLISDDLTGTASTEVFTTAADHGLAIGDPVVFTALEGGEGLTEDLAYIVLTVPSSTTFTVSATDGGATKKFSADITAGTVSRLNFDGWGYVGGGGDQRTGDLEAVVSAPDSTSETLRRGYGNGAIAAVRGTEVRASATIESSTPLDIRAGQKLTVSSTALGLSSATYRIAGVSIRWRSATIRDYLVNFGRAAPSAMTLIGRAPTMRRPDRVPVDADYAAVHNLKPHR